MEKMIKRLLSFAIALAMVLSWLPANLLVAEATANEGQNEDSTSWTVWTGSTSPATGKYKLTGDVDLTGAVTIATGKTVTLDLCGHTITAEPGTGYSFNVKGTLIIQDSSAEKTGKVVGGTRDTGGANINITGRFDLRSGTITGGHTGYRGGNIYGNGATFNMYGGAVTDGYAKDLGGNIYMTGSGHVNVKGGVISGGSTNPTNGSGGNIGSMYSNVTIEGGQIFGGSAKNGGNISLTGTSDLHPTLTISGGTVGNVATGATCNSINGNSNSDPLEMAVVDISGGTLLGEVFVGTASSFTLSGAPVIEHLSVGATVRMNPAGLTENASITVTTADPYGIITTPVSNPEKYCSFFSSWDKDYSIAYSADRLLVTKESCLCGCGAMASTVTWQDFNTYFSSVSNNEVRKDGHYYLSAPLTLTDTMKIYADVALDLRGYTITPAAGKRTVYVYANGDLAVADSFGSGVLYGATLTGEKEYGGAVYVEGNAKFALRSGNIIGGTALCGGNIYSAKTTSVIEITGGAVAYGHAKNSTVSSENRGGNIYTCGHATISGDARIIGGQAHYTSGNQGRGGNIFINSGNMEISGNAKIYNGVAEKWAGNVMVSNTASTLTISGNATVAGGKAAAAADNIVSMYSTVRIGGNAVVDAGAKDGMGTSVDIGGSSAKYSNLHITGGKVYGKIAVGPLTDQITISGAPVIKRLALTTGKRIDPTGMMSGASVTVEAADTAITDTLENAASYAPYFHAYASNKTVIAQNNQLQITTGGCPCGCGALFTDTSVWKSWSGGAISESGHYKLTATGTMTGAVTIGSGLDVVIDLNGKTLTAASGARCIEITGGKLTIADSVGTGKLQGTTVKGSGGTILLKEAATLNLYSGTITGGVAQGYSYTDDAGKIKGAGGFGGNICLDGASTLNVYGGVISSGSVTGYSYTNEKGEIVGDGGYGGNIYSGGSSKINIYDGILTGGTASDYTYTVGSSKKVVGGRGGNIYAGGGEVNIYSGTVTEGVADQRGGNIFSTATVRISGGTISNGTANNIYSTGMTAPVYISGSAKITGSSTGIALMYSTLYVSGGTIDGAISASASGANHSKIVISGGTINNNLTASGSVAAGQAPEIAITGGTFKGEVKLETARTFVLSGAPNINKLTLGSGVKITPKDLSGAAKFTITNATTGTEGDITWTKTSDGLLLLTGSGHIAEYSWDTPRAPWGTDFKEVVIGSGITGIGTYSFYACKSLTKVTIPDTVTYTGTSAFRGCTALEEITIPGSVTELGFGLFNGCTALRIVHLPVSVPRIFGNTFLGCTNLSAVYYTGTKAQWDQIPIAAETNQPLLDLVAAGGVHFEQAAQQPVVNDTTWSISGGNTLTISGSGPMGNYYYDSAYTKYNGVPWKDYADQITAVVVNSGVTTVGAWAFANLKNLTSVTLATTVTTIGNNAFRGCTALQTIHIRYVETLENNAFYGCTALKTVTGDDMLQKLGGYAFYGCSALQNIDTASMLETIGDCAFLGCTALTGLNCTDYFYFTNGALYNDVATTLIYAGGVSGNFTVPDTVTEIAPYAFAYNTKLTSVTMGDQVTTIGGAAFEGCAALQTVSLGAGVTSLETKASNYDYLPQYIATANNTFAGCDSLTAFTVSANNTVYAADNTGALCSKDLTTLVRAPGAAAEYAVSQDVTVIGQEAFANNNNLAEVTLSDTTATIDKWAFAGDKGLESIEIPTSVTAVKQGAFDGTGLTQVSYEDTLLQWNKISIGTYNAPLQTAQLQCILVPATSFGDGLTWSLTTDGVLTISGNNGIGDYTDAETPWSAYQYNIAAVVIEEGVDAIGANAFNGCSNLTAVTIPYTVLTIGDNAFAGTAVATVSYGCTEKLWDMLSIGSGNEVLETAAFTYGPAIQVGIAVTQNPNKLDYMVGEQVATEGMIVSKVYNDLSTEAIPEGYQISGALTMPGKTDITVTYGDYETTFQVKVSAEGVCGEGLAWYLDSEGVFTMTLQEGKTTASMPEFSGKEDAPWHNYRQQITAIELPEGLKDIQRGAFENCVKVTSIVIPSTVTYLWAGAFRGCTGLNSVIFQSVATTLTIGNAAFAKCSSLTEITIPDRVVALRANAFHSCSKLETIYIAQDVKEIDAQAFQNCTSLKDVYYAGAERHWNEIDIDNTGNYNDPLLNATRHYAKVVESITIKTPATKTEYEVGEELDMSGLVLTLTYQDSTTEDITSGFQASCDLSNAGTQTVTVTYAGKTTTYQVTVKSNFIPGDADGKNGVTYDDAILVLWHLAGKNVTLNLTAVDVTGTDGEVTYDDAMLILWYLAGKVKTLG